MFRFLIFFFFLRQQSAILFFIRFKKKKNQHSFLRSDYARVINGHGLNALAVRIEGHKYS